MPFNNNSNLPSIQRIKVEDFKDAPKWFSSFVDTLNLFINVAYDILNKGITYANLGVIQPFSFSFTPTATLGFKFANPLSLPPTSVILGNVTVGNNFSAHPAVTTQIYWHYSQGFIYVDDIVGLTAGVQYNIFVQVS